MCNFHKQILPFPGAGAETVMEGVGISTKMVNIHFDRVREQKRIENVQ